MAVPDPSPRPRGARVAASLLMGLLLAFGGMCGVGPTSLSLLAVASHQIPSPDDARGQVPVPAATEVADPTRRLVRRGRLLLRRVAPALPRLRRIGRAHLALVSLRAPPLRGPPALAV